MVSALTHGFGVAQGTTVPGEVGGVCVTWLRLNGLSLEPGVPQTPRPDHAHSLCPQEPKHARADTPPDPTERWDQDRAQVPKPQTAPGMPV